MHTEYRLWRLLQTVMQESVQKSYDLSLISR